MTPWTKTKRTDDRARLLADRHYSRQTIGSPHFTPPGRALVLYAKTDTGEAYWVTSWPYAQYVKRDYPDAWLCSAFRNEGAGVASGLIYAAMSATRAYWPETPDSGMITLVDKKRVKPTIRRGKETWGYCYIQAGFKEVGMTKGGLLIFQILPADMPPASVLL